MVTSPAHISSQSEASAAEGLENGHCILAVASSSVLSPSFDLSLCRLMLEKRGFQIPEEDFETPFEKALGQPSARRYLFLNSSYTHFCMAVVVYVLVWCGVYSTLNLYLALYLAAFWLLCLSVTLVTVLITATIIIILHNSNKRINVNTDVRLVQVNERLSPHKLLVGVADWVHHCAGTQQLLCVRWDLEPCLKALTETLEKSTVKDKLKHKLKQRMSHLVIMVEPTFPDGSDSEGGSPEERRLLIESGERACSTSHSQRSETKLTTDYSLAPGPDLTPQEMARQLLLTYSAVYVRLLVSQRLPGRRQGFTSNGGQHCIMAPLCLCQYVHIQVIT